VVEGKCKERFSSLKDLKRKLTENLKVLWEERGGDAYIGFSLYRRQGEAYDTIYSLSLYPDGRGLSLSEKDFSGFSFEKINPKPTTEGSLIRLRRSFAYLKFFFESITCKGLEDKDFLSFSIDLGDSYIGQFIYIPCNHSLTGPLTFQLERSFKALKSLLKCFILFKPAYELKKAHLLEEVPLLIVDLKRGEERFKGSPYADFVLTRKLVESLLKTGTSYNFSPLNHTGDGFIFLYSEEDTFLSKDFENLLKELWEKLKAFKHYIGDLQPHFNTLGLRGILTNCKVLFETLYCDSYHQRIFYSPYLDLAFKELLRKSFEEKEETFTFYAKASLLSQKPSGLGDLELQEEKEFYIIKGRMP